MPHLAVAFLILLLLVPAAPAAAQAPSEVIASGMRNPYRWSFDRATGDVYVGDVGGINEEVTYIPAARFRGANLGWNCLSGTAVQSGCTPGGGYVPPAYEYPSGPDVVIGGYVVRDPELPSFAGSYIFGRFQSGAIVNLGPRAALPPRPTGAGVPQVSGFGEDGTGRLYVTSLNGQVYRLGESGGQLTTASIGAFDRPVAVSAPPGVTGELLVAEKPGQLKRWTPAGTTTALDIRGLVEDGGEQGLLSVAVAPDYQTSGRVFIFYTDTGGDLQVDELRGGARTPVLTVQHDQATNHNGGQLLFGPDNGLYLSTGDGGTQGDPEGDAQSPGSQLGKILRIDVGLAPTTAAVRAARRQRALRRGRVTARAACNVGCTLTMRGSLRTGGRRIALRGSRRFAVARQRVRLSARLTGRARRTLRRSLARGRRPVVRLSVRAANTAGGRSALVRRTVRVRR